MRITLGSKPWCHKCGADLESPKKRWCNRCHAANMREWRKTHKLQGEAKRRANARSYLNAYVNRGKIAKQPCCICGGLDVEAHHEDYSKPLRVQWFCKGQHLEKRGYEKRVEAKHRPAQPLGALEETLANTN